MQQMFAPIYKAAALQGIAASLLDRSPPHVVAWMFGADEDALQESDDDLISLAMEREKRRGRP